MIKYIIVGKKWFDKVNGNTYHSARVYDLEMKCVAVASYEYGYGEQYVYSAFNAMKKDGIISTDKLEYGEYFATCPTTLFIMPRLVARRSSRLMPGLRGIPAVMMTMSELADTS